MNRSELHVDLMDLTTGKDELHEVKITAYKFEIRISPLELYSKELLPREIRVDIDNGRVRVRVYDGLTQEPTTILLGE